MPQGAECFEDVLRWLYLHPSGPRLLGKAIKAGKDILANSQVAGAEKDGLTAVSRGAALLLKRVVDQLEELDVEHEEA